MANGSMEADSFGEGICLILACGCWRSVHAALQMPYGPPVLTEVLLILGFDLTNEMEDHLVIQIPSTSEGVPSYRLSFKIRFSEYGHIKSAISWVKDKNISFDTNFPAYPANSCSSSWLSEVEHTETRTVLEIIRGSRRCNDCLITDFPG